MLNISIAATIIILILKTVVITLIITIMHKIGAISSVIAINITIPSTYSACASCSSSS